MAERKTKRPNTRMAGDWSRFFPFAIAACGLAAYSNSFSGVFVLDDVRWILENPALRELWPPWAPAGGTLRPVLFYSLAVNHAISGLAPWSYHAVNVAIHLLAALTLYGVVGRTLLLERLRDQYGTAAPLLAATVALIWAIHPLQTQAVTYVIQRGESLMGLFYLLTIYCAVRGATGNDSNTWYYRAAAANLLGLGTKEVMVTAPLVVLLYDGLLMSGSLTRALRERWRLYAGLAAPLALGFLYLLASNPGRLSALVKGDSETVTAAAYALSQPGVIVHYLKLCLWPHPLFIDYGWQAASGVAEMVLPWSAVAILVAGAVWSWRRRPHLAFLGAWFFLILAPTSSVVPLRDLLVEHRMYLPLAAVVTLVVGCAFGLRGSVPQRRRSRLAVALVAAASVACGTLTWKRNQQYQSEIAIWQDVIAERPENTKRFYQLGLQFYASDQGILEDAIFCQLERPFEGGPAEEQIRLGLDALAAQDFERAAAQLAAAVALEPSSALARNCLGIALYLSGRAEEAIAEYRKVLESGPEADVHTNLANILLATGETARAIFHYQKAIDAGPRLAEAFYNFGSAMAAQGNPEEAFLLLQRALELQRDFPEALNNMASVLMAMEEPDGALIVYDKALSQRERYEVARLNYGTALLLQNRYDEAAAEFSRALAANPQLPEAHNGMGICLFNQGKVSAGENHFSQAVTARPDYADAHNNLANCALARSDLGLAVTRYATSLRTHDDPSGVHHNLGKALFFLGRTEDAVRQFRRASELNPGYRAARSNLEAALRYLRAAE